MTPSEACRAARGLLEAGPKEEQMSDGSGAIVIPWEINYALQDVDPSMIAECDKYDRWFDPDVLRDKLDRMEGKVITRVTERIVGEMNGME